MMFGILNIPGEDERDPYKCHERAQSAQVFSLPKDRPCPCATRSLAPFVAPILAQDTA